jgi:hypothetical protein
MSSLSYISSVDRSNLVYSPGDTIQFTVNPKDMVGLTFV